MSACGVGSARVCASARVVVSRGSSRRARQSAAASHARRLVQLSRITLHFAAHLPPFRLCRLSRSRAWRSRRPRASQFRSSAVSPRAPTYARVVHSTAAVAAVLLKRLCWCVPWLRLATGRRVLWQWNRESRSIVRMCSDGWVDRGQCARGPPTRLYFWLSAKAGRQNWAQTVSRWVSWLMTDGWCSVAGESRAGRASLNIYSVQFGKLVVRGLDCSRAREMTGRSADLLSTFSTPRINWAYCGQLWKHFIRRDSVTMCTAFRVIWA